MSQIVQVTAMPEEKGTANALPLTGWSRELGKGKGRQALSSLLMLPPSIAAPQWRHKAPLSLEVPYSQICLICPFHHHTQEIGQL